MLVGEILNERLEKIHAFTEKIEYIKRVVTARVLPNPRDDWEVGYNYALTRVLIAIDHIFKEEV